MISIIDFPPLVPLILLNLPHHMKTTFNRAVVLAQKSKIQVDLSNKIIITHVHVRESLDLNAVAYTARAETRESRRCGMSAFGF